MFQPGSCGNPTGKGGFQKGVSGNPGGKPAYAKEIRSLAQQHSAEAIEVLVKVMRSDKTTPAARAAAASQILDRAIGRPEAFNNTRISTEIAARLDYNVFSAEELELLDRVTPLLTRPGFVIESDGNNGSPAAA